MTVDCVPIVCLNYSYNVGKYFIGNCQLRDEQSAAFIPQKATINLDNIPCNDPAEHTGVCLQYYIDKTYLRPIVMLTILNGLNNISVVHGIFSPE